MIHKSKNPMLPLIGSSEISLWKADQGCRLWGLGLQNWRSLQHAAPLLNIKKIIHAKCGETFKWLKHSPQETNTCLHQDEGIYI